MSAQSSFARWVRLTALLVVGGCQSSTSSSPSYVRADILGGSSGRYEGSGNFYVLTQNRRREFGLMSTGTGEFAGDQFAILRRGGTRPSPGDYPLGPLDQSDPSAQGITAWYVRRGATAIEDFVVTSGQLHVTSSTADRITGTFQLTGARYCSSNLNGTAVEACTRPWEPQPGAPAIEVSGDFSVSEEDGEVHELVPPELPIP